MFKVNFVCNRVVEHRFYTKMFLTSLGAVDLQIGHIISFQKSLDVQFIVLNFKIMIHCGFGAIGLEVKSVQRESDSEQRTLGFVFKGFQPSNKVILFPRSPNMLKFVLEFLSGFSNDDFEGFEPENIEGLKLGVKKGTLFQSHCFGLVHQIRHMIAC